MRVGNAVSRRDVLVGGLCLCCLPRLARAAEWTVEEVGSGIFIRRGLDEDASPANADAIANIGFIVGENAVLVTDSGGSWADGAQLRRIIKDKTDKPIRYVVQSHVHPDHAFGAASFLEDAPEFIGHANLPQVLAARGEFYRKGLAAILGEANAGPVAPPTRLVSGGGEVDLGGRTIRFNAHGPAHTHADLSFVDGQTGLLFPADLLFVGRVPSLDGNLLGWLKELDQLGTMGAKRAVPGHGPVAVDLQPSIQGLKRYLSVIRDGVRAEIRAGGSIDRAAAAVGRSENENWALFESYHRRNVIEAYRELEWE
jgi:quinoprotein relay system zinc metallohydrolase 2